MVLKMVSSNWKCISKIVFLISISRRIPPCVLTAEDNIFKAYNEITGLTNAFPVSYEVLFTRKRTRIFSDPYFLLWRQNLWENTGRKKTVIWHILHSVGPICFRILCNISKKLWRLVEGPCHLNRASFCWWSFSA